MQITPDTRSFGDRRRRLALASGVLAVMCGTTMLLTPTSADGEAADLAPHIDVVQTPADTQPPCVPAPLALSYTTESTASTFVLRVTASAPPCVPVTAHAVVYAMPGNGVAWPQRLAEQATFVIDEAGATEVRFTKGCQPAQFDVVSGATPAVISPFGAWHGPLLFPYDIATAEQYWGPGCEGVSSTSVSTSAPASSSTTAAPTTTEAPTTTVTTQPTSLPSPTTDPSDVRSETTLVGLSDTIPTEVLGTQDELDASGLAVTGLSSDAAVAFGTFLVVAGLVLIASARRRA